MVRMQSCLPATTWCLYVRSTRAEEEAEKLEQRSRWHPAPPSLSRRESLSLPLRCSREPEPAPKVRQPKVQQQLDPKVQQLMAMGFAQAACEGALRTEGSVEAATEKLLARKNYE